MALNFFERLQMHASITIQRATEISAFRELLLLLYTAAGFSTLIANQKYLAWKMLSQCHRSTRIDNFRRVLELWLFKNLNVTYSPRQVNSPQSELTELFGWRLMVLKPKISGAEKGVLLIKFSETLGKLIKHANIEELTRDYTLLVEPSWSGYCDADLMYFSQFKDPIFIESPDQNDFDFLIRLNSNLTPISVGSGDWVDPSIAEPFLSTPKKYDLVMNSHWGKWKRHYALFQAIRGTSLKVALIGFSWGKRSATDIRKLAQYYDVESQIEIFEKISFDKVMEINAQSRFAVLLSLKEGANRAIPEAMFANTPAIVLNETVGGVQKNVSRESGRICKQKDLKLVIQALTSDQPPFTPRKWAIANISHKTSTDFVNSQLRAHAVNNKLPWTKDIAERKNSPELAYSSEADKEELAAANQGLLHYVKTSGAPASL